MPYDRAQVRGEGDEIMSPSPVSLFAELFIRDPLSAKLDTRSSNLFTASLRLKAEAF